MMCASPSYLRRAGTPRQPLDLEHHDYLKFPWQQNSGHGNRRFRLRPAQGEGASVEVEMPVILQSVSVDVLHRAVMDGAGVAVLSSWLVAPDLASNALVHLLPDWVFGRFTIDATVPSRKLIPARTRAFLTFLSEMVPAQS